MPKFYVSRQCYWPEGDCFVELVEGGIDYSGPDMLVEHYRKLGEGKTFRDPREAAIAAARVWRAWKSDSEIDVSVTALSSLAASFCFGEPMTLLELFAWSQRQWKSIPKCARCGDPMPDKGGWGHEYCIDDAYPFCSENCADMDLEEYVKQLEDEYYRE